MSGSTNLIGDLTRAFDIANIEMLAVALPDAEVVSVSRAALVCFGARREELIGRQIVNFGTGSLSARNLPAAVGEDPRIEVAFVPPLGAIQTRAFTAQTWHDGDRDIMLLIGQHRNATEAELAIQNEKRLQLALRSGGYAVWDFDYRTQATTNSPEMYDLLGFARDDPDLNFNFFNSLVHPEDRRKTLDEQIRLSPFGSDVFQTKYRVRSVTGDYVWIESVAGVIRDPLTGGPAKVVGLCRNVDSEMTAIERLSSSERNLKRSQAAARLGSFSVKRTGTKSKLSAEMISLLELAADAPRTLNQFEAMMGASDRARFQDTLAAALAGQHPPGIDVEVQLASGTPAYFRCNIEPDIDASGHVKSVYGTCQCITEQKILERKFLQAQRMEAVGQLTGGIAHDFNNLLMVVMGNLQLVEQLVRNDNRALTRIRAAIQASEKGSELTKQLLAFSRQQTLRNKELAVNELAARIEPVLQKAVGPLINITFTAGENLWAIKADAMMMETAILNLALNARDAMLPKGGELKIVTENVTLDSLYCSENEEVFPGDYVEIAVTDTGVGIPKENLDKVFQPFFTTKGPEAGSGLGLSMIYGFVRQSNGHVKIKSEPGQGTTVRMYLPKAIRELVKLTPPPENPGLTTDIQELEPAMQELEPNLAENPEIPPSPAMQEEAPPAHDQSESVVLSFPPPPPEVPRKRVVLVVEDNDGVRNVAVAMLEEMDIVTLQASNGREALAILQARSDIDLVLSDVIMAGGMNGTELAIQALKFRPDLKIVFMSGYTPDSVRQTKGLPDTIDLVAKPFTRSDLTEKIYRALAA